MSAAALSKFCKFLSTPSARRATVTGTLTRDPEIFLSTPSARRATGVFLSIIAHLQHFYPRPPRGGRRAAGCTRLLRPSISIHALREEGDLSTSLLALWPLLFLSTPSARRATQRRRAARRARQISIHALREEGD